MAINYNSFCKKCKHYDFTLTDGILCGLTNSKPAFEGICNDFELDPTTTAVKFKCEICNKYYHSKVFFEYFDYSDYSGGICTKCIKNITTAEKYDFILKAELKKGSTSSVCPSCFHKVSVEDKSCLNCKKKLISSMHPFFANIISYVLTGIITGTIFLFFMFILKFLNWESIVDKYVRMLIFGLTFLYFYRDIARYFKQVKILAIQTTRNDKEVLNYLEKCGELTRDKLIKAFQLAGIGEDGQNKLVEFWDSGDNRFRKHIHSGFIGELEKGPDKVQCRNCGISLFRETSDKYGGLCARCCSKHAESEQLLAQVEQDYVQGSGELKKGLKLVDEARKKDEKNEHVYLVQAALYEKLGDQKKKDKALKEAEKVRR